MTHTKYTGKGKLVYNGSVLTKNDLLNLIRALFPKFSCMYGNKHDKSFLVYMLIRILPNNTVAEKMFTSKQICQLHDCLKIWYHFNVENRG